VSKPPETVVYKRPPLYKSQEDAIFHDKRYGIIEASTKSGKTVGCLVWILEKAMQGGPQHNYWWVAPVYPQAKVAYRRLKAMLPRDLRKPNESELTLELPNGSTIWFKSGDNSDSLYGEDVYAAVIDEASRCREDSWYAVRSTLTATKGHVRIIGNVKGRKNWAYRIARRAESGEQNMHFARITAQDAIDGGVLDKEEIDDAERAFSGNPAAFRELYYAEASDDGGNPFSPAAIKRCLAPLSPAPAVVWGWDLAKSNDWTVGIGLDSYGTVSEFARWQKPWQDTVDQIVALTRGAAGLVDSTGLGDPVLEQIQQKSRDQGYGMTFEGYTFSSGSKQMLMEGLAVAINREQVHFPDGPIRRELEAFEYEYTRTGVRYSVASGLHDDCVMALALAQMLRMRATTPLTFTLGDKPQTHEELDAQAAYQKELAAKLVTESILKHGAYFPS
jgi:hypothetical protein